MGGITVTILAAHKEPAGAAAKEAGEWGRMVSHQACHAYQASLKPVLLPRFALLIHTTYFLSVKTIFQHK